VKHPEILLLEGSAEVRRALEEGLSIHGYAVTSVATPSEALELLRSRPFDLLIGAPATADRWPVGTLGPVHEEFPDIPSVVIAGDAFDLAVLGGVQGPGPRRRLLRKPFTLGELITISRVALNGHGTKPDHPGTGAS